MPRKPRPHVPGGLYHVILRGNGRRTIFFDDDDRHLWESLLDEGICRYGHRIHAYCWMTNHIHMVVQSRVEPVSSLMRLVASRYARSTNRKMNRSGHLFERRHLLIPIRADSYMQVLVRYIHQNPLRAGMISDLSRYPWSSHRAYLGKTSTDWLTVDWVLSMFGDSVSTARRRYRKFMRQIADDLPTHVSTEESQPDHRILGDDGFAKSIAAEMDGRQVSEGFDEIIARICAKHSTTEAELCSRSRARTNADIRAEIAEITIATGAATLATIARHFNRSESVLSRSLTRMRVRAIGLAMQ